MRRFIISPLLRALSIRYSSTFTKPPIISIKNATFYRHHPASHTTQPNPELFKNLHYELPSFPAKPEHWAILGAGGSGKTTFLQILRGQHLSFPPRARSYPYLNSEEIEQKNHELRIPSRAIEYVGFGGEQGVNAGQGTRGAYLSARYESLKEATDWTVMNYLQGHTELNPSEEDKAKQVDPGTLKKVINDLRLVELVDMPVANLSNGQTRRAKIAKAILGQPEVLLLDEVCSSMYSHLSIRTPLRDLSLLLLSCDLTNKVPQLTCIAIHGLRSTYAHEPILFAPRSRIQE